eukprot:1160377-Pelagomonas_calceolata.AAC.2
MRTRVGSSKAREGSIKHIANQDVLVRSEWAAQGQEKVELEGEEQLKKRAMQTRMGSSLARKGSLRKQYGEGPRHTASALHHQTQS